MSFPHLLSTSWLIRRKETRTQVSNAQIAFLVRMLSYKESNTRNTHARAPISFFGAPLMRVTYFHLFLRLSRRYMNLMQGPWVAQWYSSISRNHILCLWGIRHKSFYRPGLSHFLSSRFFLFSLKRRTLWRF